MKASVKFIRGILGLAGIASWLTLQGPIASASFSASLARASDCSGVSSDSTGTPLDLADASRKNAVAVFGDLPLSFEANSGQADEHARFLSHENGYNLHLAAMPDSVPTNARPITGDVFARLPLRFEACGKDSRGRFLARTSEYGVYVTATEALLVLRATAGAGRLGRGADLGLPRNAKSLDATTQLPGPLRDRAAPRAQPATTLRMRLIGSNRRARAAGEDQLPAQTNYFIGKNTTKWRTGVASYERVKAEQVYRGIDVVYYGSRQQLEYDFNVAPKADPSDIRLRFEGACGVRLNESGELLIETAAGEIRQHKPIAYQFIRGTRREVTARYAVTSKREISFVIGSYDKNKPLVIDPVLSYATYVGSRSGSDFVSSVATDAAGNVYIVGSTSATDLPTTPGALQPFGRLLDTFIAKLNPAGTAVVYATYLGGSDSDYGASIAVDAQGNAFITGTTYSNDFPTTAGAFQSGLLGGYSHAFVAKLNAEGTALVYSTYLGSSGESAIGYSLAVDAAGQATLVGYTDSPRFPTTPGALQPVHGGGSDGFVARLNREGNALIYSTYLGGDGSDSSPTLALDREGNAYVTGNTYSTNFPTTRRAYKREKKSSFISYVAKINNTGDRLVYSTFVEGETRAIAVDLAGSAYVTGAAFLDQPATAGALQPRNAGGVDAFVMKLNPAGSELAYSTFIGGGGGEVGNAIAVDSLGQAYVTGTTTSSDFPLMKPLQSHKVGGPLFKSTDGGGNWDNIAEPGIEIRSLAVDPQVTSTLYASGYSDIVKSTDGGTTWRVVASGRSGSLVIDPVRPGVLYAFNYESVHRSTDAGATWQSTDVSLHSLYSISALVIDPKNPDTLYLSARMFGIPEPADIKVADATYQVMFKSTDGGASWSPIVFPFIVVFGVVYLAVDPHMPNAVYAGTESSGLLKTTDGGASWFGLKSDGPPFIRRLVPDPVMPGVLYGASYDAILKSTDEGYSWSPTALQHSSLNNLEIDSQTPARLYAGGYEGLNQTTDGGKSWRVSLDRIVINAIAIDPKHPATIYAGSYATNDVFVAKLNPAGTAFVYSTYLGGQTEDFPRSITADAYGNAYIAGVSSSADFPVTPNAYQTRSPGGNTGFVVRIADPAALRITDVRIKGKKLLVSGEGFEQGAVIVVDATDFETRNDPATPSVLLISPRGGKQIASGKSVVIRVRNADGRLSDGSSFTR